MRYSRYIVCVLASMGCGMTLSGCASTYGNMVSGSKLGADSYQPAVYVPAEDQAKYQQILAVCRNVAVNRQITAAQEAQLHTITGTTTSVASGAAAGMQFGAVLKGVGGNTSVGQDAAIGAAAGLISGLASAFSAGTQHDAAETKRILLNCLRSEQNVVGYKVLE